MVKIWNFQFFKITLTELPKEKNKHHIRTSLFKAVVFPTFIFLHFENFGSPKGEGVFTGDTKLALETLKKKFLLLKRAQKSNENMRRRREKKNFVHCKSKIAFSTVMSY